MATKKDFTQFAHAVFMQATGAAPKKAEPTAKQLAGKKGGLKGGKSRMDALSEEQRTALAMQGVAARKKAPAGDAGALVVKK